MRVLRPMTVERVQTATGSRIEPPLNDRWSEEDQLRWKAAVVSADTGLRIELNVQDRVAWFHAKQYGYSTAGSGGGSYDRNEMWTLLSGFSIGASAARAAGQAS